MRRAKTAEDELQHALKDVAAARREASELATDISRLTELWRKAEADVERREAEHTARESETRSALSKMEDEMARQRAQAESAFAKREAGLLQDASALNETIRALVLAQEQAAAEFALSTERLADVGRSLDDAVAAGTRGENGFLPMAYSDPGFQLSKVKFDWKASWLTAKRSWPWQDKKSCL